MKIIFFGTSDFAAQVLRALIAKHEVAAVVTQPDRKIGRKQEITASAVAKTAEELGLNVLKPELLRDETFVQRLKRTNAQAIVVAAYGKIIPKNILALAGCGALNIHPSILPKYRGASPIQAALLNGDKETGITIMLMDEQMDHGPIVLQEMLKIEPDDNTPILAKKLANLAQILLLRALSELENGQIKAIPQDDARASYCKIIQRADGKINWSENTASQVYNMQRAYYPWPGIWTVWGGKNLKIKVAPDARMPKKTEPGKVLQQDNGKVLINCATGTVEIVELQLEGGQVITISNFLLGHKNFIGATLGS